MAKLIPQIGVRLALSSRYRNRYREITSALLRHGFGVLVTQLGLTRYVPVKLSIFGQSMQLESYSQAEHVRMLFEELGTTFIKLGQVLSTRVDLLPPDYISELEKLQDRVPPVDVELIKTTIRSELGKDAEEVFAEFDPVPLASASIGQVHAARLKTGEEVAVKIRRPGVSEVVDVDTSIIMELARLATKRLPIGQSYDLEGIAREFVQTLLRELDYIQEARNVDRFRQNFHDDDRIVIPDVFWDYTSNSVVVTERLGGIKINDVALLKKTGINPRDVAKNATDLLLKQVFEFGFFHADPHPANFLVQEDARIAMLDFGMVGFLDKDTKAGLVELFLAVFDQDPDAIIDSYIELGVVGRIDNYAILRSEISHIIKQYYGRSIKELDIRSILNDVTSLVRRYNLRMPSNLALLSKTVAMQEGLVMNLDPTFRFAEEIAPFAKRVWLETYSPTAIADRSLKALSEYAYIGLRAPRQLRRIMGQLSRGELTIVTNQPRLDEEMNILNKMVNKLIAGIISSALLIFVGLALSFFGSLKRKKKNDV
ncbi:MAG: AarF/ABC1/UbiB kinase family protein [Rubrobacteridae bacterium]|nr:AarF/ABC1/UbiB kinase family protein [Rubrobacteridae bacterium]